MLSASFPVWIKRGGWLSLGIQEIGGDKMLFIDQPVPAMIGRRRKLQAYPDCHP
jgi:hypothetical protein